MKTVLLYFLTIVQASHAATVSWNASSGFGPEAVGYTLTDTATPEDPTLIASTLTLSTDSIAEVMTYRMEENQLEFASLTQIDFRMRFVTGSENFDQRGGALVSVYVDDDIFTNLWFRSDEVFTTTGSDVRDTSNMTIDTDDVFHDYQLIINGTNPGDTVQLFQDSSLVLTSQLFTAGLVGLQGAPRIAFGEGTGAETGTSDWQSFSHNAAVPEPSSTLLLGLSCAGLAFRRSRQ